MSAVNTVNTPPFWIRSLPYDVRGEYSEYASLLDT